MCVFTLLSFLTQVIGLIQGMKSTHKIQTKQPPILFYTVNSYHIATAIKFVRSSAPIRKFAYLPSNWSRCFLPRVYFSFLRATQIVMILYLFV